MKKFILSFIILFLMLSACDTKKHRDLTYIDDLKKTDLAKPKLVLESRQDFIYALDYLAYYRVDQEVYFKVNEKYAQNIANIYQEFQSVYLMADLADVYPCNIEEKYYKKERLIGIRYSIAKDIATHKNEIKKEILKIKNYDDKTKNKESFKLPIETKKKISCENSEQLYYLAMNGYCPKPIEGSVADVLYQKAKEIIFTKINQNDSDFIKIKKIYDYLTTEILYDKETQKSTDRYLIKEQAYYLEGVFLNHYAVCDGKAKAYALLLNMVGIPCFRTTGTSEKKDHAWNMLKLSNQWYISCSTYGQGGVIKDSSMISPSYPMMLLAKEDFERYGWEYETDKHKDIIPLLAEKAFPIYQTMKPSMIVHNLDDLIRMISSVKDEWQVNHKIEFKYIGEEKERFEMSLASYFKKQGKIKVMKVKGDTIYQLIYLKKTG